MVGLQWLTPEPFTMVPPYVTCLCVVKVVCLGYLCLYIGSLVSVIILRHLLNPLLSKLTNNGNKNYIKEINILIY